MCSLYMQYFQLEATDSTVARLKGKFLLKVALAFTEFSGGVKNQGLYSQWEQCS